EVRVAAPTRVEPPCPYFGTCGGCQWQHIAYEHQLVLKQQIVREQLRRIGHFADAPVGPTVASPAPYGYRNHIRLTLEGDGKLGYISRPGDGYHFLRVATCPIAHPAINAALTSEQGHLTGSQHVTIRYGV